MTNSIGTNGISIDSLATIVANITSALQGIYGTDINVDQNSPDGQCINVAAQGARDLLEFLVAVNNGFNPDLAVGAILDQRVAYNNIQRQGGTYTVQPIDITVNATVNLQGLDGNYNDPNGTGYTVQDSSGNEFILAASDTLTAGLHSVDFRAQQIGAVNVPVDTITTPVTVVPGVVSVNNSSSAISVGQTQETDAQLRTRRQQSVALSTTGYLNGLLGAIKALPGVTNAVLYNNPTGAVVNTMVAHSIWLVVTGGANADIANEIYNRISDGCNMNGAETYDIATPSGVTFTAQWDNPTAEPLYIRFTIKKTTPGFIFSQDAIKQYIVDNSVYNIGQFADTSLLTTLAILAIVSQGGGGVPVLMEISDDGISYTDYLDPTGLNYQFTVAAANIDITVV